MASYLDGVISANHPRKGVSAEATYQNYRNANKYDAQKMTEDEEVKFVDFWNNFNVYFSPENGAFSLLTQRHMEQGLSDCEIMKKFFKGAKFSDNPLEGEFGGFPPLVEDLVGATDTEWGATTGGTAAWTAGQRGWFCTLAQNAATYAAALVIKLHNNTADYDWGWTFFGVQSFSSQPVVKNILIKIGNTDQPIEPVENKFRGSQMKIAMFSHSKFVPPDRGFKVGVEVGTSAQDQITPYPSIIWKTGANAANVTHNRPIAA